MGLGREACALQNGVPSKKTYIISKHTQRMGLEACSTRIHGIPEGRSFAQLENPND